MLERCTRILENGNYWNSSINTENTTIPLLSRLQICLLAKQIYSPDDKYEFGTPKKEQHSFYTGFDTIIQVLDLGKCILRLLLHSDHLELKIPLVYPLARAKEHLLQRSSHGNRYFYCNNNETVCFDTQRGFRKGIPYLFNWKCNTTLRNQH